MLQSWLHFSESRHSGIKKPDSLDLLSQTLWSIWLHKAGVSYFIKPKTLEHLASKETLGSALLRRQSVWLPEARYFAMFPIF